MAGRSSAALIMVAVLAFAAGYAASSLTPQAPPQAVQVQGSVQVTLLNDREYYPVLLHVLSRANKSIHIAMFMYKTDTDVIERITELLISKSRQGVDVRVVLENSVDVNELAYRRLRDAGIPVRFDTRARTTHAKLVIVDGKIVIVGSHNFTYSAMERNHEASVMLVSDRLASIEEKYFEAIWGGG